MQISVSSLCRFALILIPLSAPLVSAAGPDGQLDPAFGSGGRTLFGYLESDQVQLRGADRFPSTGLTWLAGTATDDLGAIYLARVTSSGQPDASFGANADGRRRTSLPNTLIPQTEALQLDGLFIDDSGKPVFFGGLQPSNAETGAFPALICRLAVAGSFDPSFDGDGCQLIRSFVNPNERCTITDAKETADHDLVVVGNCQDNVAQNVPFLARLNANGSLDQDFAGGAGVTTPAAPAANVFGQHYQALDLRADGRIVVLGTFNTAVNSIFDLDMGLIQFDAGGSIDPSFGSSGYTVLSFDVGGDNHDRAIAVSIRPDGRVLALGEARLFSSQEKRLLLAQTLASGSLDPSFDLDGLRVEDADHRMSLNARATSLLIDAQGRALITSNEVQGQPDARDDRGTDFWLALPASVPPNTETKLLISSDQATTGMISSVALANPIAFNVSPTQPFIANLPDSLHDISALLNGGTTSLTLRVQSQAPVSVVPWSGRSFSIGTTLVLPNERLGKDYRVMAWGPGLGAGSQVVIVATRNNTNVSITAPVAAAGHPANVPFQISLQAGQRYDLRADTTQQDLTGAVIRASQPIAVYSGHTCAEVPDNFDFCDSAYEQQRPRNEALGTEFAFVPRAERPNGDVIRVLADAPETTVYFNGSKIASLGAGETMDVLRSSPGLISTSQPALVAQFSRACSFDAIGDSCPGDPSQLSLEPTQRWARRYLATVPNNSLEGGVNTKLLTIIAPQSAAANVRLNGMVIGAASFSNLPGSHLAFARITRPGANSDEVSADAPIWVYATGIMDGEMYAHGAAAMLDLSIANSSASDLVLRLLPNGSRDPTFASAGLLSLDHTSALGGGQPSFDQPMTALSDSSGILIGTSLRNGNSNQQLMMLYRLSAEHLFRDGFE